MEKHEIIVVNGEAPAAMAKQLAVAAGLAAMVGSRDKKIGLKPNLVLDAVASQGATTHPEIVAGLIEYLQEEGFHNLVVLEGSWVGSRTQKAFKTCGYTALSQKYGVPLVDTQQDTATAVDCAGLEIKLCDSALAVDFMINLPVMKGHCQTGITCALKNNKGIIPNGEKRRFHSMGLHRPIAHLNLAARNDFIVVDAICGDLDFEEGGNPVPMGQLFAACDPVLCDAYAAREMGFTLEEVPYIGLAEALGVGSANLSTASILQLNSGQQTGEAPKTKGRARELAAYAQQDSACSACYAALIRAFSRMGPRQLQNLPAPVCVGQGFSGKTGQLGVGRCTSGFAHTVGGCPPSASDIMALLNSL